MKDRLRAAVDAVGLGQSASEAARVTRYARDRDVRRRNRFFAADCDAPLPPPRLVYLVGGVHDLEAYYRGGKAAVEAIMTLLVRNGFRPQDFRRVLDFGCGCARLLRHWPEGRTRLVGVDHDRRLIEWSRRAFPHVEFEVNALESPLAYDDESFDLVYAVSVFTHLGERAQLFWIRELRRVLTRGGLLLLTLHGRSRLDQMTPAEQKRFARGAVVVQRARHEGSNRCAAFHPEAYVRKVLAAGFEVLDFVPAGRIALNQDVWLLRRD
jgi:SAM-dependent methyltransferase